MGDKGFSSTQALFFLSNCPTAVKVRSRKVWATALQNGTKIVRRGAENRSSGEQGKVRPIQYTSLFFWGVGEKVEIPFTYEG